MRVKSWIAFILIFSIVRMMMRVIFEK